jgi:hypothetical protein
MKNKLNMVAKGYRMVTDGPSEAMKSVKNAKKGDKKALKETAVEKAEKSRLRK